MKKIGNVLLVMAIAILFVACTIEDKIKFNEDFSGTYQVSINMGEMMKTMDLMVAGMKEGFEALADSTAMDEPESDTDEPVEALNMGESFMSGMAQGMKEITDQIDSLELAWKVKNLKFEVDSINYVTNLSFDFPSLKSLGLYMNAFNEAMNEETEIGTKAVSKSAENTQWVYLKGNKLIFKGDASKAKENKAEGDEMEDLMMPMMNQSITISSEYTFPKNIKKTNHPFAVINGKTAKINYNLQQMMDEGLDTKDIYFEF